MCGMLLGRSKHLGVREGFNQIFFFGDLAGFKLDLSHKYEKNNLRVVKSYQVMMMVYESSGLPSDRAEPAALHVSRNGRGCASPSHFALTHRYCLK